MAELVQARARLTRIQEQILDFIRRQHIQTGIAPSYREIQSHFGYSAIGTVQDHVRAIRRKGYLEPAGARRSSRSLIPSQRSSAKAKRVIVYGEIAAGKTRLSEQLEIGSVFVPEGKFKQDCFALRVVGDSMTGIGIYEDDVLIVVPSSRARHREIVVAMIGGETTVKRYVELKSGRYLLAENPAYRPIPLDGLEFSILGRAVGLHRDL